MLKATNLIIPTPSHDQKRSHCQICNYIKSFLSVDIGEQSGEKSSRTQGNFWQSFKEVKQKKHHCAHVYFTILLLLLILQAVCCSDGKHCCPENTKCEVSSGKCLRGDSLIMDWFEKTPALRAQNVVCPDGQSQCRTGQTCCKLSSGQYGCCPLPKVCRNSIV